jgi:hypothetical protein
MYDVLAYGKGAGTGAVRAEPANEVRNFYDGPILGLRVVTLLLLDSMVAPITLTLLWLCCPCRTIKIIYFGPNSNSMVASTILWLHISVMVALYQHMVAPNTLLMVLM